MSNEERDQEMQTTISNMLQSLEKEINQPLTENQIRQIFKKIHLCLTNLAHNKENIKEHR